MSQQHNSALDQALAALRAPALLMRLRDRSLPDDLLFLLQVAAGDSQARDRACQTSGRDESEVTEAAGLFIQQVMFYPGSDSYRVLGVDANATASQIKEHHRWLVRWLHPDRNEDDWVAVYADRVNQAWQDLRTPERRAIYASRQIDGAPVVRAREAGPISLGQHGSRPPSGFDDTLLSSRTVRRLPVFILSGLALGAVMILAVQYSLSRPDSPAVAETGMEDESLPAAAKPAVRPAAPRRALPAARVPVPSKTPAEQTSVEPVSAPTLPSPQPAVVTVAVAETKPKPKQVSEVQSESIVTPVAVAQAIQSDASHVQEAPVPAVPPVIDQGVAREMILRFRSAYSSGNINQVRSLLSSGSAGAEERRSEILRSYGELFASSASRRIEIHNLSWLSQGETAILVGSFKARIVPRGRGHERRVTGNIRFDLRRENGELLIVQVDHESERSQAIHD